MHAKAGDHYRTLEVDPSADLAVIKASYRALARVFHPDVQGDDEVMKGLNRAWEVLGDPDQRAKYDSERAGASGTIQAEPGASAFAARRPADSAGPPQGAPLDRSSPSAAMAAGRSDRSRRSTVPSSSGSGRRPPGGAFARRSIRCSPCAAARHAGQPPGGDPSKPFGLAPPAGGRPPRSRPASSPGKAIRGQDDGRRSYRPEPYPRALNATPRSAHAPPVERSRPDYYRVLQVDPAANPLVIQAAYRVLAQIWHPDVSGDDAEMKRLNAAWEVLGDPRRRKQYDIERAGRHPGVSAGTGRRPHRPPPCAARRRVTERRAHRRRQRGVRSQFGCTCRNVAGRPTRLRRLRRRPRPGRPTTTPARPRASRSGRCSSSGATRAGRSARSRASTGPSSSGCAAFPPAGASRTRSIPSCAAAECSGVDRRRYDSDRQQQVHAWAPGRPRRFADPAPPTRHRRPPPASWRMQHSPPPAIASPSSAAALAACTPRAAGQ